MPTTLRDAVRARYADACKPTPQPFSRWLLAQCCRVDEVGVLAAEAHSDPSWPHQAETYTDYHIYLRATNAPDEIVQALIVAWREWRREVSGGESR